MQRRVMSLLLGVASLSCGPMDGAPAGMSEPKVIASSTASVQASTATTTGTVELVRNQDGTYAVRLTTPMVMNHVVADGLWVFAGSSPPAAGVYAGADAAPGSWFRCSELGGDVDSWPSGPVGARTLTLSQSSASALHGTLEVNLKFSAFTATF